MAIKFISKREDGKGHRKAISSEISIPYSIKVPTTLKNRLDKLGPTTVRIHLQKLANQFEED